MSDVGKRLRALRLRAGLSLEQSAQAMGLARASSAQHYEDDFKKQYLPLDKVAALAKVMVGRGEPAITEDEVFALAAGDNLLVRKVLPKPRRDVSELAIVREVGGGQGAPSPSWGFPDSWLRHVLTVDPQGLHVVAALSDSMAPTVWSGDRLIVNASLTNPSPAGLFVIRQESALVPYRLALTPNSSPLSVRLSCDNTRYPSFDRPLSELDILGRVIALLHWL